MSGDIMQTWVFFLFLNGENGSHFGMMHFTCCLLCPWNLRWKCAMLASQLLSQGWLRANKPRNIVTWTRSVIDLLTCSAEEGRRTLYLSWTRKVIGWTDLAEMQERKGGRARESDEEREWRRCWKEDRQKDKGWCTSSYSTAIPIFYNSPWAYGAWIHGSQWHLYLPLMTKVKMVYSIHKLHACEVRHNRLFLCDIGQPRELTYQTTDR